MAPFLSILGILWLAGLCYVSYELLKKVLGEACLLTRVVATPGVAAAFLVLFAAYLWPYLGVVGTHLVAALVLGTLGFLLSKTRQELPDAPVHLHPACKVYLVLGSLLTLFYGLFGQTTGMVVDGDLFVHITEIGLFQEGHYPPKNPFLIVPTHGHFGRQMLIAQLSSLTGLHFLETEWLYTCGAQIISFLLLFCLIWRVTGSQWQGALGSAFGFFAADLGSSIGIADTVSNHNPSAILFLMTGSYLILRILGKTRGLSYPPYPGAFWAGLLLGADALVYEIHLGLMILAAPCLFFVVSGVDHAKRLTITLLMALVMAGTAGGVGKDMVQRALGRGQATAESAVQQRVKIKIPKDNLFQIRLDNLRPSRPFETRWRPWSANFESSTAYADVRSKRLINIFWWPVWCFPLALLFLLKHRNIMGVWFGTLAVGAGLAPSIVDFGFFEGESLRWLFVVAVGGSICFGLAAGTVLEQIRNRWVRTFLFLLLLAVSTVGLRVSLLDAVSAVQHPGQPLPIGRPGVVEGVGLMPRPFKLLKHHYSLKDEDFEAAAWIRRYTPQEALILTDDVKGRVNARAAVIGLQGRFPAGYVEPDGPTSNPQSYPRSSHVYDFLDDGEATSLKKLGASFVVLHKGRYSQDWLQSLARQPGIKEVYENDLIVIFSYQAR